MEPAIYYRIHESQPVTGHYYYYYHPPAETTTQLRKLISKVHFNIILQRTRRSPKHSPLHMLPKRKACISHCPQVLDI